MRNSHQKIAEAELTVGSHFCSTIQAAMLCMRFVQARSELTQRRMMVRAARLARLEVTEVILTILSRVTHCPCREQQGTVRVITSLRLGRKYWTELE